MATRLQYSTVTGAPFGFGSLSTEEVRRALRQLTPKTALTQNVKHAFDASEPMILLVRAHYLLFYDNIYKQRMIFDSFGSVHASYLLGRDVSMICNKDAYQNTSSDTCGLFCILAFHVFVKYNVKSTSLFYKHLHSYIIPLDFVHNEFVITVYAVNNYIGEEFDSFEANTVYSRVHNVLQLNFRI